MNTASLKEGSVLLSICYLDSDGSSQLGHSCCEGLGRTRSLDIPPGPDLCLELGLPTGRVGEWQFSKSDDLPGVLPRWQSLLLGEAPPCCLAHLSLPASVAGLFHQLLPSHLIVKQLWGQWQGASC